MNSLMLPMRPYAELVRSCPEQWPVHSVVLFVDQDLANLFAHSILSQFLALANSLATVSNRFSFVREIEL
jgi:hypothetical protein